MEHAAERRVGPACAAWRGFPEFISRTRRDRDGNGSLRRHVRALSAVDRNSSQYGGSGGSPGAAADVARPARISVPLPWLGADGLAAHARPALARTVHFA